MVDDGYLIGYEDTNGDFVEVGRFNNQAEDTTQPIEVVHANSGETIELGPNGFVTDSVSAVSADVSGEVTAGSVNTADLVSPSTDKNATEFSEAGSDITVSLPDAPIVKIEIDSLAVNASDNPVALQVSDDGGTTFRDGSSTDYEYTLQALSAQTTDESVDDADGTECVLAPTVTTSREYNHIEVTFSNPQAAEGSIWFWDGCVFDDAGRAFRLQGACAFRDNVGLDAVRLFDGTDGALGEIAGRVIVNPGDAA